MIHPPPSFELPTSWKAFAVLVPALRKGSRTYGLALTAAVGGRMIGVGLPLLARHALAAFPATGRHGPGRSNTAELLTIYGLIFLSVLIIQAACGWSEIVLATRLAQNVIADVRACMYRKLQTLSERFFDRRAAGRVLVRFIGDANALQTWIGRTCVHVPADILMLAAVGALIGMTDMYLLVCVAAPLAIVLPVMLWLNPFAREWTRRGRREQSLLAELLAGRIESMRVVKSANLQAEDAALAGAQINRVSAANQRRAWFDGANDAAISAGSTASLAILTLCGAWLLTRSQISHGDLLLCIWLAVMSRGAVTRLARANVVHQRARVAVERIQRLLNRRTEAGWDSRLQAYSGPGSRIRVKNLGYRGADGRWLLRGLTRTIRGPRLVCLTDLDGSAGTAVLELLIGLRRPHTGRVALDRVNLRKLRIADVRQRIAWIDCEARWPALAGPLPGVAEQLDSVPARRIWAELSFLDEVRGMPLHAADPSQLLRTGWKLTRADRLRVALVLCLLKEPAILLLDDPTAGLSPPLADRLTAWLLAAARDRLVIVASNNPMIATAARTRIALSGSDLMGIATRPIAEASNHAEIPAQIA